MNEDAAASPDIEDYVSDAALGTLLRVSVLEDLGPMDLDATSDFLIPEELEGSATFGCREAGVIAGLAVLPAVAIAFGMAEVTLLAEDGDTVEPGSEVARIAGPMRDLLRTERTALNLLTHLSGVASLTRRFVDAVAGTRAVICETRKTLPGLRGLQKYATACGGATPHRTGLYDAMLIKDNHLAHLMPGSEGSGGAGTDLSRLRDAVTDAAERARMMVDGLKFVEVEVDTLDQLRALLGAPIDIVLLDNMSNDQLREAVALRDAEMPALKLEASGGVNLDTVAGIAATGVDRISVGALTHSAPALDIGLDR